MEYENVIACGRGQESAMPAEDLTNMLRETRAMARDAGNLADKISAHLFGSREDAVCCSEAKRADTTCFKEELSCVRRELMGTIETLAKICTLVGA